MKNDFRSVVDHRFNLRTDVFRAARVKLKFLC
jgi:hypothetical protein